jgi:hypothetical protein
LQFYLTGATGIKFTLPETPHESSSIPEKIKVSAQSGKPVAQENPGTVNNYNKISNFIKNKAGANPKKPAPGAKNILTIMAIDFNCIVIPRGMENEFTPKLERG